MSNIIPVNVRLHLETVDFIVDEGTDEKVERICFMVIVADEA